MQVELEPAELAPRVRRTQQERREKTRTALLEATLSCLVECGYAGTTTLEVERRAGVSRGARIHHYPTKAQLVAAAIDHLYDGLAGHYATAFGQARPGGSDAERLRSGLRVMWSVYCKPGHVAALELSMAARTDAEVRAHLHQVALRHRALALAAGQLYFPQLEAAVIERLVLFIHSALLGLLMERNVSDEPARDEAVLSTLEAAVVSHLPQPGSP
jgi:AcrR family transcriptional regulator